jgi:CheY-like chemotaxis protein
MSHTLLLADDSVTVQRVIELTFADEGFKVVSFSDGDEAVNYLEAGNAPDVILADTTMPARDGYDVAAWVKGKDALGRVPVVLMTGAFEPIDDTRAEACQADAILVKPFEPQQVVSLVRRMLAGDRGALLGEFAPPRRAAGVSASPPAVVAAGPGFDTYAARLDEHLAARQGRSALARPDEAAGAPPEDTAKMADASDRDAHPSLAEAFSAILAAERGEGPDPTLGPALSPAVTDALIDAVAEKVLARMSDQVVREVVSRHVLDVAERLVTAEIERIKSGVS